MLSDPGKISASDGLTLLCDGARMFAAVNPRPYHRRLGFFAIPPMTRRLPQCSADGFRDMPDDASQFDLGPVFECRVWKGQCDDWPKQGAGRVYELPKPVLISGFCGF